MKQFLEGNLNTTKTEQTYGFQPTKEFLFPKGYDCRNPLSIFDFMLQLFWKKFFWDWTHFIYFLSLSPSQYSFPHYEYKGDLLVKTQNLSFESLCHHHKSLFLNQEDMRYCSITLPSNLFGLYTWLLIPTPTKNKTICVFELNLPANRTYYKITHPEKYILKNRLHHKNPFSFL